MAFKDLVARLGTWLVKVASGPPAVEEPIIENPPLKIVKPADFDLSDSSESGVEDVKSFSSLLSEVEGFKALAEDTLPDNPLTQLLGELAQVLEPVLMVGVIDPQFSPKGEFVLLNGQWPYAWEPVVVPKNCASVLVWSKTGYNDKDGTRYGLYAMARGMYKGKPMPPTTVLKVNGFIRTECLATLGMSQRELFKYPELDAQDERLGWAFPRVYFNNTHILCDEKSLVTPYKEKRTFGLFEAVDAAESNGGDLYEAFVELAPRIKGDRGDYFALIVSHHLPRKPEKGKRQELRGNDWKRCYHNNTYAMILFRSLVSSEAYSGPSLGCGKGRGAKPATVGTPAPTTAATAGFRTALGTPKVEAEEPTGSDVE